MTNDAQVTLVRLSDSDLTLAGEADDARGRTVVDRNGEEVGQVDDLLIDPDERRVRFLQVASGGFLGLGESKRLVPVDAVTAMADTIQIDKDRDDVAKAPIYDPELVEERGYYESLYGYYGYSPYWSAGYMFPGYPYR